MINYLESKLVRLHKEAIESEIFEAENYIWVDFGIFKILNEPVLFENLNKQYHKIRIGTIWNLDSPCCINLHTQIAWYFAGGIFGGDKESLLKFSKLMKKEVLELRKRLNQKILLVIDDAYAEYMKNKDYSSGLDLFKNKDNVFILRTFSKMFGLASLRVGWGYGSKKIVDALNVIKPPFNVNGIAQLAATESLKDKAFINKSIRHNLLYSEKIKKFLETYNIFSNSVSANFLLLNFEKCRYSAKFLYEKLKNKGIILRSTEDGYHIKNKLRLTIGSKKENIKFMSVIKQVLKK